jgi:hypothetical protein
MPLRAFAAGKRLAQPRILAQKGGQRSALGVFSVSYSVLLGHLFWLQLCASNSRRNRRYSQREKRHAESKACSSRMMANGAAVAFSRQILRGWFVPWRLGL